MAETTTVKVSNRYQISLPSAARQQLHIQAGDRLLVDIQEGMLVLVPQPQDFVEHLAGLHREIWRNLDIADYLERERAAWPTSNNE
ncbi:MAG: AbrB/MazE/SpoVT family DNA-binding domain-containing protein [Anaerolineae bacterium]